MCRKPFTCFKQSCTCCLTTSAITLKQGCACCSNSVGSCIQTGLRFLSERYQPRGAVTAAGTSTFTTPLHFPRRLDNPKLTKLHQTECASIGSDYLSRLWHLLSNSASGWRHCPHCSWGGAVLRWHAIGEGCSGGHTPGGGHTALLLLPPSPQPQAQQCGRRKCK